MKAKTLRILKLIWKILKFILSAGETFILEESKPTGDSSDGINENVVNQTTVLTLKKKKGDTK